MKIAKSFRYKDNGKNEVDVKALDGDLESLFQAITGRVRFGTGDDGDRGENIAGEFQTFTTDGTPDTEGAVSHGLGSVPIGYIVISKDKAGHIYDGTTSWTSTNIYLRSDVASVTATVFLIK